MNKFTLEQVISKRILDPVEGWRDRKPKEYIKLNIAQQNSFVALFGYRCRANAKEALRNYIEKPHGNLSHTWWLERVKFIGDRCHYTAGQDYPAEIATIRSIIVQEKKQ